MNNAEILNELNENVHIRCFHGPAHAGAKIYPVRNPLTGEFPSCVRRVDSKGDIIYDKNDNQADYFIRETDGFEIKNGTDFDLTNPIQKANWEAIRFSELIFDPRGKLDEKGRVIQEPSDVAPANSLFYVERIVDETKKRNQLERTKVKAKTYIYGDSASGLTVKAKILGCFVKTSTREEIEEFLINVANTDPEKIINLYTGSDMKLSLIFITAKEKNILQNKGGLFIYNETTVIGRTMEDCIRFFKDPKNKVITDRIIKEVTEALTMGEDGFTAEDINPTTSAAEKTAPEVEVEAETVSATATKTKNK